MRPVAVPAHKTTLLTDKETSFWKGADKRRKYIDRLKLIAESK